jgi:hypothetical protein
MAQELRAVQKRRAVAFYQIPDVAASPKVWYTQAAA